MGIVANLIASTILNILISVSQLRPTTYIYIHTYLAQISEIGQGLGRFLSCGARKQEQT